MRRSKPSRWIAAGAVLTLLFIAVPSVEAVPVEGGGGSPGPVAQVVATVRGILEWVFVGADLSKGEAGSNLSKGEAGSN